QSKFTWWKNGVLGTIVCHAFLQKSVQLFAIGWFMHIDKIDNHDTAHITYSQLPCDFLCCFFIYQQRIFFLIFFTSNSVTAIDIHYVERFGVLNYKIGTTLQVYRFAERRLNLFFDTKMVKNRFFMFI